MQLHTLKRIQKNRRPKARVGRGGKRGTTAGRGTKGQKARSGHRIRPAERDYIQRLPKMRGVTHRPIGGEVAELHVADLAKIRHEGAVTLVTLKKDRLISRTATRVKILDGGEVTKSFVLQGVTASVAARKKIEAAGGRLESGNA